MSEKDTEQLRREIVRTRAELGETVQELAERADVPARVKARVVETRDQVQSRVGNAARTPVPWVLLAAAGAALVAVLVIRWRRR
jgi:hypothetical protein